MATLRYVWNQYASPLMLLLLLAAVVVGVAVGVGLARVRVRRGKAPLSRGTYLVGVLLWLWLVGMVCVTLLGSRGSWGSGEVNLQLFLAWEEAWYAGDLGQGVAVYVLNLALFPAAGGAAAAAGDEIPEGDLGAGDGGGAVAGSGAAPACAAAGQRGH